MNRNNKENILLNNNAKEDVSSKASVALLDKKEIKNLSIYEYTESDIRGMIHEIRGQQVILDSDLAKLFGYSVKRLNEQVRRNIERFPDDFMFQLTIEETKNLPRSQNATLEGKGANIKYGAFAFTEQGVNQLSSVLKGPIAVKQSVTIMRVFVKMRHYLIENRTLFGNADILKSLIDDNIKIKESINNVKMDVDSIKKNITTKDDIQNAMNIILDSFIPKENLKQFVFKDGQPFEANETYINIYKEAKHSIYIIDDYINCHTLSLLTAKKSNVDVVIFSDNKGRGSDKLNKLEFNNFNIEYPTLSIKKNNGKSHDRFIILDYKLETEKIYHCGASSKDAGKKVCCISPFSTSHIIYSIIDDLLINDDYMFL
ncbi:MAG: ORF6N domain-containing protein [Coprobacillus sp.]